MIGDIDILTEKGKSKDAFKLLSKNGYNKYSDYDFFNDHFKHERRQINGEKRIAIEVHKKLFSGNFNLLNENKIIKESIYVGKIRIPKLIHQLNHNILNQQINDKGYNHLNYNYKNYYDTMKICEKGNIDLNQIKTNKYLRRYFLISDELNLNFKIENKNIFDYLVLLRFSLKSSFKFYYIFDKSLCNFFYRLKIIPMQIRKILTSSKYRAHISKKYLSNF